MRSSNLWSWFRGSSYDREREETVQLYREVERLQSRSPFTDRHTRGKFILDLIDEICDRHGITPTDPLGEALFDAILGLLHSEGFALKLPDICAIDSFTLEEGVAFRRVLNQQVRFIGDHERLLPIWREKLVWLFAGAFQYFPLSAFTDPDENGTDTPLVLPEAKALDLCENLPELIERVIVTVSDTDVLNAHLFDTVRDQLDRNLLIASGVPYEKRYDVTPSKLALPSKQTAKSPEYLVDTYLRSTPFHSFFNSPLPFAVPFPARFEHTHIVAGSGHGKTQLLQFLIHHDLIKATTDRRSVIVIDSQGDMIRTLSHLQLFDSTEPDNLADRFVLIDPTDIEHPVGLNMFDFDRARLGSLSAQDREMILNATVETYEYFFGALLGAEMTQRQGVIFRYIARLMMEVPDATIHTLLDLMLNGEKYRPYMEQLTGTARTFFATQFFDRQFSENKKQIVARLWGVLSNTTLERMFSHPKNKVDLFRLTQEGKIIFVNTAKDFLGHEGSSIFGRFIVSLIAQAAIQRAILPAYERTPTFAYIDEAEDYFDDNIDRLVNQARKYKIGLVFSHQNLDQLSTGLRASILASTSIKFAGGLSSKDANALDAEFRTNAESLLAQKKHDEHTEFACYIKNYTAKALSVRIPLGFVEAQPTLDEYAYRWLIETNRALYSVEPIIPEIDLQPIQLPKPTKAKPPKQEVSPAEPNRETPAPKAPSEVEATGDQETPSRPIQLRATAPIPRYEPKEQGGGGKQHKYLAHLVKQLAEERGFKASIEEEILGGAGRVDVLLSRNDRRIAVEISVTTGRDWELQNVEKCISAGFEEVLVVSTNERHLKSLARFIPINLDEAVRDRVRYFSPEDFIAYLDQGMTPAQAATTEKTVRGYKVRVTHAASNSGEAEARRSAIAEVIAQSMLRAKD